ncbi:helix-turn-helix transcriptional regulator [Bdellovibrio bacteriovorus]|uniref:helix-turn-helix transcriptional regulator n=1 Tax=Bdellovibrio bacteriovorus TaxID=959 RepID=UPI0005A233B7|nr:AlpA family phage regulatory protein [Bdellovibrio bacteriovorus]
MSVKIICIAIVAQRIGVSKSTILRMERAGKFVPRAKISPGRFGYSEQDVERWIQSKFVETESRSLTESDMASLPYGRDVAQRNNRSGGRNANG